MKLLAATLVWAGCLAASAADEPAPDWARTLRLAVTGGPVASNVEVSINGEFVLEIQDEAGMFHEISDVLKPGRNEIKVTLKNPEQPREGIEDLRIEVIHVRESSRRLTQTGSPLAAVVVPSDAKPDPACAETALFTGGPPPTPAEAAEPLKSRYWLFVEGPPSRMRASLTLNGTLVYDGAAGNEMTEITPLVKKGKNSAVFDVRPSCFAPRSGRSGLFSLNIVPAVVEADTVKANSPPLASIELDPKKAVAPYTAKRSFRGW